MSNIIISAFGVTNFRSFDDQLQALVELQPLNLFVGRNNAGKSNVLAALRFYCAASNAQRGDRDSEYQKLLNDPFNRPLSGKAVAPTVWLPFPTTPEEIFGEFADWPLRAGSGSAASARQELCKVLEWISREKSSSGLVPGNIRELKMSLESAVPIEGSGPKVGAAELYRDIFNRYSGYRGGGIEAWLEFFQKKIDPFARWKEVKYVEIPSVRKIIDAGSAFDGTFGEYKIIQTIAEWERPDAHNLSAHTAKFQALLAFVRFVLEDERVDIQIPFRRNTVHIVKDGKTLPIERLGTGIHQVVMLAAAATVIENAVVAVEEPETNLHPSLQRKLLRYLLQETSNQYFITTHSAHILDAVSAGVFHVSLQDGHTRLSRANTSHDRFCAVEDLGYRASDLIQTPIVVWVEGPSDRIYLTSWLSFVDDSLVEGTHYSVMFYGGRLLSHLSAHDPEVDEFISLRRLNRYVAIVIDSDRRIATSQINATKTRVVEETEANPLHGLAWVTDGREIENYLNADTLENVIRKLAKDFARVPERRGTGFRFANVLEYVKVDGAIGTLADKKVAVAREYIAESLGELPAHENLASQLQRIVALIRRANQL